MKNYTLKIQNLRQETNDSVTLCFKQPGLKKIKYLAGQYLTLQFRINGRRYIRPYSFSSTPLIDSTLDVTVKRVPGGIVSNYINDHVKVDDVIEVQEPLGDFVIEPHPFVKSVFFWGVGSGITPLYSMIKQLLAQEPDIDVYLIYGNRSSSSIIFRDQLERLKATYSKRFKIYNFISQEDFFIEDSHNFKGRINRRFVETITNGVEHPCRHYICGPLGLKTVVRDSLFRLNGNIDNVFSEDFEIVKNPADFENITDQEITLSFQGNESKILVKKGKSILEEALEIGIELPYSCQTGNCSTCKGKVVSGQLKMIGLDKIRTDLCDDEYLLCCSYPLANNVHVEVQ